MFYLFAKQRAMYRWILEPTEREALLANLALKNANKNYQVIVEISCVLSPEELFVVRRAYHNRYKRSLEEDVAANTSGHLRQASHEIKSEWNLRIKMKNWFTLTSTRTQTHIKPYCVVVNYDLIIILSSFWWDWWAHLGMEAVRSMQDWHNLKLIYFMRLSKTRIRIMKKLLGFLPQGARSSLWQLSTATGMTMELPSLKYIIKKYPLSLLDCLVCSKYLFWSKAHAEENYTAISFHSSSPFAEIVRWRI